MDSGKIFYQHNIGKFAVDTRFMNPTEIGIYVILKDMYLSEGMRLACDRIANLFGSQYSHELKNVLNRFYREEDGFYVCEEYESELEEYKSRVSTNSANARKRWERKRMACDSDAKLCDSHTNGVRNDATSCLKEKEEEKEEVVVNDTTCHMSEETSDDGLFGEEQVQKPEPTGVPNCPTQKIVDLYHQILPELPKVTLITSARQTLTRSRWRDLYGAKDFETMEQGLEVFKTYFEIVKSRDFLMGRCKPSGGREVPFRATYDWLMKQGNFMKVCEGNYVNSRRK